MPALSAKETIVAAQAAAEYKAARPWKQIALSAILAGFYIGFGSIFSTLVYSGAPGIIPFGFIKLFQGIVFSVGLAFVVLGGAELFTGAMMLALPVADKRLSLGKMLKNWGFVYFFNFIGSITLALLVLFSGQYLFGNGVVGEAMLKIASGKAALHFIPAICLGILCNLLVSIAIFLSIAAQNLAEKVIACLLPISAFIAMGFEHSVANMYIIPTGLFLKLADPAFAAAHLTNPEAFTWGAFFLNNLIPVTLGNIIGGLAFWLIYREIYKKA